MYDIKILEEDEAFLTLINELKQKRRPTDLKEVINHYNGDSLYVREMILPAGCLAIGRIHLHSCVNFMLEGAMRLWSSDRPNARIIKAPDIFESKAGVRRAVVTFTNVRFATAQGTGHIPDWVAVDDSMDNERILGLFTCNTRKEYNQFLELRGQHGKIQDLRS